MEQKISQALKPKKNGNKKDDSSSSDDEPSQTPNQLGNIFCDLNRKTKRTIGKLKLDQGFKSVLRGIRKAIRLAFYGSGLSTGKHHWSEARWMDKGREFLEEFLNLTEVTDWEVAAINLLLYHSFGPSKAKPIDPSSIIYIHLKDDGMQLFKQIFDNNSNRLVVEFFSHPFVKKLWPTVLRYLTKDVIFGDKDSYQ